MCFPFNGEREGRTQHFADVGLYIHILEVLVGVGMEQPESGVQTDGHPDPITHPCQLAHLALLTRVGIEGLLQTHTVKISMLNKERKILVIVKLNY